MALSLCLFLMRVGQIACFRPSRKRRPKQGDRTPELVVSCSETGFMNSYLPAYLPTYLPACLPACLPE